MSVSRRWSGSYYDGRTAARHAVDVEVQSDGLHLHFADGRSATWPFAGVRRTQGAFSREQTRLEFGEDPAESLLVDEPGFSREMRVASPAAKRAMHGNVNVQKILKRGIAIALVLVAAYVWLVPIAADYVAQRLPLEWEVAMGSGVAERVAAQGETCGDPESLAILNQVLARLVAALPEQHYDFRIRVLRDTTINAFAAPGGFIAVHSGLLAAAKTPEEFAGVLSHEMEHVVLRHSTRAMLREIPLRMALTAMSNGGMERVASLGATLGSLNYRRQDEAEADREGMRLLQAARVDPAGAVAIMKTLEASEGGPSLTDYLASHPRTADRVAEMEALVAEWTGKAEPLVDSARWARVRRTCQ